MSSFRLPIAPESCSYLLICSLFALFFVKTSPYLVPIPAMIGLAIVFFFRDPERTTEFSDNKILSPADGKITGISFTQMSPNSNNGYTRVSIYLSFLDVHINRAPIEGLVKDIRYSPGKFFSAYRKEALECNENNLITFCQNNRTVFVRQIAGKFARRIVCRCVEGDYVQQGQRIGMIQFGSGVEVYVPRSTELRVCAGQRVKAGETVIAAFP